MTLHQKINTQLSIAVALLMLGSPVAHALHPGPQPRTGPSIQTLSADGMTTTVVTSPAVFDEQNPFIAEPPGSSTVDPSNLLQPTIETNMLDGNGDGMPNTLPSTAANPYNLHLPPVVNPIDKTSPTDDIEEAFSNIEKRLNKGKSPKPSSVKRVISILEGRTTDRAYDGLPLLHYNGPEKVKVVQPVFAADGETVIGGNVNVHQVWYDSHIESDTAFIDPSAVLEVPWTITYTVDTLNRGHDDFSPMVMYFDAPDILSPSGARLPHVAMDQTFFPIDDGTRTVFKVDMSKGQYYNLSYTWGWRVHPPRVQVSENALKKIEGKTLPQWEIDVFGPNPTATETTRDAAIAMIGDLSPAKRMWQAMRAMDSGTLKVKQMRKALKKAKAAFDDWKDRTRLPSGVKPDPDSDWTLLYVNNTLYGQIPGLGTNAAVEFPKWQLRGTNVKIKLYNGDFFEHAYTNVDFGGQRGWENMFHSTLPVGGSGPWFSFGRMHWWMNAGAPPVGLIRVPPASNGTIVGMGEHNVDLTMNFEPSRRLRWYQFDPLHHDVAVWSIH